MTLLFVGTKRRLRNFLLKAGGVDIADDPTYDASFVGVGGLTFPYTDSDGASTVVVWLPRFDWNLLDLETLSHECLHASVMVMRMSGEKPRIFSSRDESEVDDEGLAYRQSAMFASMLAALARKQRKSFRAALAAKKSAKVRAKRLSKGRKTSRRRH